MAKAKEQLINVPLRKEWLKVPRTRRAKKAVHALRDFIARRTRVEAEQVKIGPYVNELIWQRGIQKPPHHVLVKVIKEEIENKTYVFVEDPKHIEQFLKTFKKEEVKEEKVEEKEEKTTEEQQKQEKQEEKEKKKEVKKEVKENKKKEEKEKTESKQEKGSKKKETKQKQ